MKLTILTADEELALALERYIYFVFNMDCDIMQATLGQPETLEPEMLSSELWIIEAINFKEYLNPEGFRTAKKFAEKSRILLLFFGNTPENFPKEGKFWLVLPSNVSIADKLKEILKEPPPSLEDFIALEEKWDFLKIEPSQHHKNLFIYEKFSFNT